MFTSVVLSLLCSFLGTPISHSPTRWDLGRGKKNGNGSQKVGGAVSHMQETVWHISLVTRFHMDYPVGSLPQHCAATGGRQYCPEFRRNCPVAWISPSLFFSKGSGWLFLICFCEFRTVTIMKGFFS